MKLIFKISKNKNKILKNCNHVIQYRNILHKYQIYNINIIKVCRNYTGH